MGPEEFAEAKESLLKRATELTDIGEMIRIEREQDVAVTQGRRRCLPSFNRAAMKKKKEERQTLLEFRQAVTLLEQDKIDFLNCSENYEKYNPLIPFAALFGGFISGILSLLWFLQIILYVLPKKPITPFLNSYFSFFDFFPLFGVLSVAIFSLYLLFCAIKGCFKVGLRILFFTLHPMAPGKTYMSSFLFNIGLILLCSVPVVQFSVQAFSQYAKYTNIYQVMGTQIMYMTFFNYFFVNKVFIYVLLSFMLLTCLYLAACRKKDVTGDSVGLRDRLKSRQE